MQAAAAHVTVVARRCGADPTAVLPCLAAGNPPRGEVLVKGDPLFSGYYKDEASLLVACMPLVPPAG